MAARRTSYASVLSGNAAASNSSPQPTRSGFLSNSAVTSSNAPAQPLRSPPATQQQPNTSESLQHQNGANQGTKEYWDKGQFAQHQTPFGLPGEGFGGFMGESRQQDFFIPSYLKGSKYVEKLEERSRAKASAQRDGRGGRTSSGGTLSASASGTHLHKLVPSHRGMTHEIVERPFTRGEDTLPPLPARWSSTDKFPGLELHNDGLDVKFTGPSGAQDEAAAVRSDHPMPKECGIYYFEVSIMGKGKEGFIGVGFSGSKVALKRLPGWEADSWAYHGDDGFSFCQTAQGKAYGPRFGYTDTIGCGMNFRTGCAFFTKNGVNLGIAFREVQGQALYPSVGLKKPGEHIKVNFGQTPFVFDIDSMIEREKELLQDEINAEPPLPTLYSNPAHTETRFLQELVAQYLANDGYIETAKAFALESQNRQQLLYGDAAASDEFAWKEDQDAIQRQQIRAAILEGDVDRALAQTKKQYPRVLQDNENTYFKLRCRKFIEMIRKCTEPQLHLKPKRSVSGLKSMNGQSGDGHMDIDTQIEESDSMEIEDIDTTKRSLLMNDALEYGQTLQSDFKDDPRREVKQALEDTFALIAYPDARQSSLAPLLEIEGRIPVAEELNSAILVSLGKSSSAALERLYQQSEVLINDLSSEGGGAALINVRNDYLRCNNDRK